MSAAAAPMSMASVAAAASRRACVAGRSAPHSSRRAGKAGTSAIPFAARWSGLSGLARFHGPRACAQPVSRKTSSDLVGTAATLAAASAGAGQLLPRGPTLTAPVRRPPWDARVVLKLIFGERVPVCLPLPFQSSPVSGFCSREHKCDERASATQALDSKRKWRRASVAARRRAVKKRSCSDTSPFFFMLRCSIKKNGRARNTPLLYMLECRMAYPDASAAIRKRGGANSNARARWLRCCTREPVRGSCISFTPPWAFCRLRSPARH
ncbi:hypothetical protein D9M68_492110 [compost metagenome]